MLCICHVIYFAGGLFSRQINALFSDANKVTPINKSFCIIYYFQNSQEIRSSISYDISHMKNHIPDMYL